MPGRSSHGQKANSLTPEDGDKVKEAFRAQLTQVQSTPDEGHPSQPNWTRPRKGGDPLPHRQKRAALPETKRLRDKQHLRFVAKQPCLVCGREPCDPHHLRFCAATRIGQKVSDEFTVRFAGRIIANCTGPARKWSGWSRNGLEPLQSARSLWTNNIRRPVYRLSGAG